MSRRKAEACGGRIRENLPVHLLIGKISKSSTAIVADNLISLRLLENGKKAGPYIWPCL